MRKLAKPTEQETSEGPQTVSFQIANGNARQGCTLQTRFPTKLQAQKYLLTNWPIIEKMARDAPGSNHAERSGEYPQRAPRENAPGNGQVMLQAIWGSLGMMAPTRRPLWDGRVLLRRPPSDRRTWKIPKLRRVVSPAFRGGYLNVVTASLGELSGLFKS